MLEPSVRWPSLPSHNLLKHVWDFIHRSIVKTPHVVAKFFQSLIMKQRPDSLANLAKIPDNDADFSLLHPGGVKAFL
jgi:hypothetical protein